MSETKSKATTEGLNISNLDDILKFIDENFPEGLRSKRKEDFFEEGCYIGFNLSRYGYTDLLAAECHALRDNIMGKEGRSYGFPFQPHVLKHKDDDDKEWYEVYTE
tara:strand:- start:116 stop:433 length:318 start_codon:yes stop_codon:yes gene_type:complete